MDFLELVSSSTPPLTSYIVTFVDPAGSKVEILIKELPAGVCPLFFPILHENKLEIRENLWREGIETLVHWNRILPEQLELNKYPDTKYIADRQFSIPIHQDLKKKHS